MKTKFLSTCTGLTMVLFGAGFFVYSINNANAQTPPKPVKAITNEIVKNGKYQISICKGNEEEVIAVVLNTESGKSEAYRYIIQQYVPSWVKMKAQLPDFTF